MDELWCITIQNFDIIIEQEIAKKYLCERTVPPFGLILVTPFTGIKIEIEKGGKVDELLPIR